KSDPSSITVQAPSGETRTYPMSQVAQVQYADGAAAPASSAAAPPPANSAGAPPLRSSSAPPPPMSSPSAQPVPPPQPVQQVRTIPSGATISVRNNEAINSQTASPGQSFSGVVAADVLDTNGNVAIPKGSDAALVVRQVSGQGKLKGQSELVVDVGSVTVAGHTYRLDTSDFAQKGTAGVGKNRRTAEFLGGGTALGGIIGAIAGGGKGAAIGALSGAAAGGATQAITRGKAVRIPSETLLNFTLESPVQITELN
ncbi:MAG: hypothetical protein KGN84_12360, partial [Acidobacteriota bacterium]|nr:hypothetical protein [Acidobacteriota bacterium]